MSQYQQQQQSRKESSDGQNKRVVITSRGPSQSSGGDAHSRIKFRSDNSEDPRSQSDSKRLISSKQQRDELDRRSPSVAESKGNFQPKPKTTVTIRSQNLSNTSSSIQGGQPDRFSRGDSSQGSKQQDLQAPLNKVIQGITKQGYDTNQRNYQQDNQNTSNSNSRHAETSRIANSNQANNNGNNMEGRRNNQIQNPRERDNNNNSNKQQQQQSRTHPASMNNIPASNEQSQSSSSSASGSTTTSSSKPSLNAKPTLPVKPSLGALQPGKPALGSASSSLLFVKNSQNPPPSSSTSSSEQVQRQDSNATKPQLSLFASNSILTQASQQRTLGSASREPSINNQRASQPQPQKQQNLPQVDNKKSNNVGNQSSQQIQRHQSEQTFPDKQKNNAGNISNSPQPPSRQISQQSGGDQQLDANNKGQQAQIIRKQSAQDLSKKLQNDQRAQSSQEKSLEPSSQQSTQSKQPPQTPSQVPQIQKQVKQQQQQQQQISKQKQQQQQPQQQQQQPQQQQQKQQQQHVPQSIKVPEQQNLQKNISNSQIDQQSSQKSDKQPIIEAKAPPLKPQQSQSTQPPPPPRQQPPASSNKHQSGQNSSPKKQPRSGQSIPPTKPEKQKEQINKTESDHQGTDSNKAAEINDSSAMELEEGQVVSPILTHEQNNSIVSVDKQSLKKPHKDVQSDSNSKKTSNAQISEQKAVTANHPTKSQTAKANNNSTTNNTKKELKIQDKADHKEQQIVQKHNNSIVSIKQETNINETNTSSQHTSELLNPQVGLVTENYDSQIILEESSDQLQTVAQNRMDNTHKEEKTSQLNENTDSQNNCPQPLTQPAQDQIHLELPFKTDKSEDKTSVDGTSKEEAVQIICEQQQPAVDILQKIQDNQEDAPQEDKLELTNLTEDYHETPYKLQKKQQDIIPQENENDVLIQIENNSNQGEPKSNAKTDLLTKQKISNDIYARCEKALDKLFPSAERLLDDTSLSHEEIHKINSYVLNQQQKSVSSRLQDLMHFFNRAQII